MARHNVTDLWSLAGPDAGASARPSAGALVRAPTGALAVVDAGARGDLQRWSQRVPMTSGAMISAGGIAAGLGAILAFFNPIGFAGAAIFGAMITIGGGLFALGVAKAVGGGATAPVARRPSVDPNVMAERERRVRAVLDRVGQATFEQLLGQLRWTQMAMLETLVHLKERGSIVEDLDLDTGEWVYRVQQDATMGLAASLTLAERGAHSEQA